MPAPTLVKNWFFNELDWAYEATLRDVDSEKRFHWYDDWPPSLPVEGPNLIRHPDIVSALVVNGRVFENWDSAFHQVENRWVLSDKTANFCSIRTQGHKGRNCFVFIYPKFVPDDFDLEELFKAWRHKHHLD